MFGLVAASLGALRVARVRLSGPGVWLVPFGSLIVLALRPFWEFATSGLEMGLLLGWIGASFWALVTFVLAPASQRSAWRFPLAVLLGLGPVIRPDIALFSVCFMVALLVADAEGRWPGRVALLATGLAIPIAYQVFRMGYYGALIPNTAIAKSAGTARWDRGLDYLWNLIHPYRLEIPLALVAVALIVTLSGLWANERRLFVVVASPVVAGLAHGTYVVGIGGDFMHARLLLPALFAVAMPVAIVAVARPWALAGAVGFAVWAAVSMVALQAPNLEGEVNDEHFTYMFESRNRHPVTLADYEIAPWLESAAAAQRAIARGTRVVDVPPIGAVGGVIDVQRSFPLRAGIDAQAAIAFGRIGALSYAAGPDVFILDRFGLGDPLGSRLDIQATNKPGHERFVSIAWIEARLAVRGYEDPDPIRAFAAGFGRKALGCGDLGDLMYAVSEPLTPGRFLSNLVSSPRFTALRVPENPVNADTRFCVGAPG